MAKQPKSFRNFTAFVEGVGYGGQVQDGTPPKLALDVFEHLAGGMGGPIDIPSGTIGKMETTLTIDGCADSITRQFGKADGSITLRGSVSDGETSQRAEWQMRGLFKEHEVGSFKAKDKGSTKIMATLEYCKYSVGGETLIEADVMGNSLIVDGVDILADIRRDLGE